MHYHALMSDYYLFVVFCGLDKGHVKGVQPIMAAKVPIVKITDTGTGVECDLSVENRDGISKSLIIRFITSIDQRFQKLSFLVSLCLCFNNIVEFLI